MTASRKSIAFLIAWFDQCHARGLRVYPQAHTNTTSFTFTLADWNLFDDSEAWREATLGSTQERLTKLSDPPAAQNSRITPTVSAW